MIVLRLRTPPENEGDVDPPPDGNETADPAPESLDASDLEEIGGEPPPVTALKSQLPGLPKRHSSRPPPVPSVPPLPRTATPRLPPVRAITRPPLPPLPPLAKPTIPAPNRPLPSVSVAPESAAEEKSDASGKPVAAVADGASATRETLPKIPSAFSGSRWHSGGDDELLTGARIYTPPGGVEVGTLTPNLPIDQVLEAQLEHPTVVDNVVAALGDSAEKRASEMLRELDACADTDDPGDPGESLTRGKSLTRDPVAAAGLAYELGELCERQLNDEARAVKAYGRALQLDPSLRANLWAIRRVFYRRELWPNLVKLVDAELEFARDAAEHADLLLEKAQIAAYHMDDPAAARAALEQALLLAPNHQGVLLELERLLAKADDGPALLDAWERLADAADYPARKIAYLLEVAREASAAHIAAQIDKPALSTGAEPERSAAVDRATRALDRAVQIASTIPGVAVRVARERIHTLEQIGTPPEVLAAIETLATLLTAALGDAGSSGDVRYELVALRRRQASLLRDSEPEKAWEFLQQARALAPEEALVRLDLTELAEQLGRYDALAELVQTSQEAELDPERALALSLRRADALLRSGRRVEARALLESLEAKAPGFIVLSSSAEREALARNDIAELTKTYLTAAEAASLGTWTGPGQPHVPDPNAAAALYVQAAELMAYELGAGEDLDAARVVLNRALEAVPHHAAAVEALVELEDSVGHVEAALGLLRDEVARAAPEAKRLPLQRAIGIARYHGDLETVLALERELYALAPDQLASLWHLESTLAQLGHDDERADVLLEIARKETHAIHRGTALLTAARLRERSGAVEAATDLYREVVTAWPDDAFARESLVDLLRAQERWSELVAQRRKEAQDNSEGPAARRALREAAWVLEVHLGDVSQAAQVYSEWLVRFPDDRFALEGAARCRSALGDREGEVVLYASLVEADRSVDAQWLHAQALERANHGDEAVAVYRSLLAAGASSVASTAAAVALGELAVIRGDAAMRSEALAALGARVAEPRLKSALAADSGFWFAFALNDFERAAAAFRAATATQATDLRPQFGAALVAARGGDAVALGHAYQRMAEAVTQPEVAAALWLRSSSLAAAAGDVAAANRCVTSALRATPSDAHVVLVATEASTAPRVDAVDPFAAIDPLLLRAEALQRRADFTDDVAETRSWEMDRAEALELAGRLREAGSVIRSILRASPGDLRALSALRRLAIRAGDVSTHAQASLALARSLSDSTTRLELLREAVAVFDGGDSFHNTDYAVATYLRILEIDAGAPELDRLFELLRLAGESSTLVRVISNRLTWLQGAGATQGDDAIVPLLLERAAVMLSLRNRDAAIADLDAVLERVPDQIEALRFRGRVAFHAGDADTAVRLWRRYVAAEPLAHRRKDVELRLAQVLAETVGDTAGAIEQLEHVVDANFDDADAHERLLELCVRASDWPRVTRELRQLVRIAPSSQEKARAELRLGTMLRDRVRDANAARLALQRARDFDPFNLEIVRALADALDSTQRDAVLAATATALRGAIAQSPGNGELYERLSQVSAWQHDLDSQWLALVGVEALGTLAEADRNAIAIGRANLSVPASVKLDDAARARLRGTLGGPVADLWRISAPAIRVATGGDPGKLGFGRGDKVANRKLGDTYPLIAGALTAFEIGDIEIYVSSSRPGFARALAGDPPLLCLGADVAAATTPADRFHLGRAIGSIAEGMASLDDIDDTEFEWTVVSVLTAVDAQIPPGLIELTRIFDRSIAERAKLLKKQLSRKARAQLVELTAQSRELNDIAATRRAAFGFGCRAGLTWCGDVSVALEILDVGKRGPLLSDWPTVLELVAWSVSEDHLRLRDILRIAVKDRRP